MSTDRERPDAADPRTRPSQPRPHDHAQVGHPTGPLRGPDAVVSLQKAVGNRRTAALLAAARIRADEPATYLPPMIPAGLTVQRFNMHKDDATVPTQDVHHPALVNLGVTRLGPYEFHPMRGTFTYRAPAAPAQKGQPVFKFLKALVNDLTAQAWYQPERPLGGAGGFLWTNPSKAKYTPKGFPQRIRFHPHGVTPARPVDRYPGALLAYRTTKVGFPAGGAKKDFRVPGLVRDAMLSEQGGAAPRAFVSVANEDVLGAKGNAHNMSRHVLGGAEVPDETAVAVRAAFAMVGGLGGPVKAYNPTASAFKTQADADMDVGNVIATELAPPANWNTYRKAILIDGGVTIQKPRAGGNIVAFTSRNPVKAPWALTKIPTYLAPGSPGRRPLFYPDPRWDAWAAPQPALWQQALNLLGLNVGPKAPLSPNLHKLLKQAPLTVDASANLPNVNVRIVSSDDPTTKGWFINSAYPCV